MNTYYYIALFNKYYNTIELTLSHTDIIAYNINIIITILVDFTKWTQFEIEKKKSIILLFNTKTKNLNLFITWNEVIFVNDAYETLLF